ncbi:hypothetical protein Bca4012_064333 [Brassica carinata]
MLSGNITEFDKIKLTLEPTLSSKRSDVAFGTTTNMAFNSIQLTLLYGIHSGFINDIIKDAIIEYLYTIAF